jgi:hypothetical protein
MTAPEACELVLLLVRECHVVRAELAGAEMVTSAAMRALARLSADCQALEQELQRTRRELREIREAILLRDAAA